VSHLRPEDRNAKHSRAACRKGRHSYGESQNIGAGILRRVCGKCGEVTIDLTGVDEVTIPVIRSKPNIASLSGNDP
jgi:hypothetical protein